MKYKIVRQEKDWYGKVGKSFDLDFLEQIQYRMMQSSSQDTIQRLEGKIEELSKVVAMLACKLCPDGVFEEYGRYDERLEKV